MESGRDLRINKDEWVKTDLKSRKQLALGLQLDICKSFFSWFPDLKNGTNLLCAVFFCCKPHSNNSNELYSITSIFNYFDFQS